MIQNKIREYRIMLGLSQFELAKKIGITRRGLLYIEKHSKDIKLSTAYKIAKSLNRNIDEVFCYIENNLD